MIENITLGQIGVSLTLLVGIIGGIVYLKNKIKEWVEDFLDKKFIAIDKRFDDLEEHKFKAIDKRFDDLEEKIDKVDEETCKNFLVRFLGDVERDNADIPISMGEYSKRVLLWQKFLNWYFGEKVVAEDSIFGDYTYKYTKKFQKLTGVKTSGKVTAATLAKAKVVKK